VDILGEIASIGALITYFSVHICVIVVTMIYLCIYYFLISTLQMRYKYHSMRGGFQVPFGGWLIPTVGALLCILLLINTTKGTGVRFAVWIAIGHIFYFGYSFRHAKARLPSRQHSILTVNEMSTIENTFGTGLPSEECSQSHMTEEEIIGDKF
jgi:hypothetical protein